MVVLCVANTQVKIDRGELVSFVQDGEEVIHQKGAPGWGASDIEMFPVIGPTVGSHYKVQTAKGVATLEQHGLLRELSYSKVTQSDRQVVFKKSYRANSGVANSKFPERSSEALLSWPYDFEFVKRFTLSEDGLQIDFEVIAEEGMPFMLGYHPAFAINTAAAYVLAGDRRITLAEVLAVGDNAYELSNVTAIQLHDQKKVDIRSSGFNHFMLWTPTANMLCIEPITFYPYVKSQQRLEQGFQALQASVDNFSVHISVS